MAVKRAHGNNLTEIDVWLIHETDKAWLFNCENKHRVWFPKSWGEIEHVKGTQYTLYTEQSKAEEKELV